jgi:two-component system, OmpR family, phosphate regulon sensor histidine kinase PhoR
MARKRSWPIVTTYVLSLLVAVALLVVWVVYVVQSVTVIREVAGRVGLRNPNTHWVILAVGCGLFFLLIVGLTYQLAQAVAARRYSEKQEEFVSNITHEMKSPLAAIKLHAQTLQEEGLTGTQRERSLAFILQQSDRMAALVDNVLESSRLLAGKKRLELAPLDLKSFFTGYFEEAETRVESQGVSLTHELATQAVVLASPEALDRVMNNLLDNAARFSPAGGEVRCRVSDADGLVRIEVEDDGVGIPRKELEKVFDRFYQLGEPGEGRRSGTGLGLSIVAGLVREMRGEVRAFSQEDEPGSRFVIELPRAEAQG